MLWIIYTYTRRQRYRCFNDWFAQVADDKTGFFETRCGKRSFRIAQAGVLYPRSRPAPAMMRSKIAGGRLMSSRSHLSIIISLPAGSGLHRTDQYALSRSDLWTDQTRFRFCFNVCVFAPSFIVIFHRFNAIELCTTMIVLQLPDRMSQRGRAIIRVI